MNRIRDLITKKRFGRWLIDVTVIVFIFGAIKWWQTKDLLPDKTAVSVASIEKLPVVDGSLGQVDWSQDKPTLIYFFAPWCSVCHYSIGNLNELRISYSESKLRIFIIALDYKDISEVQEFLGNHDLDIPVLLGNQQISQYFNVGAFPTYYLINNSNQVVSKNVGYSTEIGLRLRALRI